MYLVEKCGLKRFALQNDVPRGSPSAEG